MDKVCIYDDGSVDNTYKIVSTYADRFKERNVLMKIGRGHESGGVGFAKNQAVFLSAGRFLCFNDADDISSQTRIQCQHDQALSLPQPDLAFIGSKFTRDPPESTVRFTKWANGLNEREVYDQVFTSFGPTLIAPTWFVSRKIFNSLNGFKSDEKVGFPEDLDFFMRALELEVSLIKVARPLVTYRHHAACATFSVDEQRIWKERMRWIQTRVLDHLDQFSVWNAGKQGKRFFRSLTARNQAKVREFCDVDKNKLERGRVEFYDERARKVTAAVPIVPCTQVRPPVVLCVKWELTGGAFESLLANKRWTEARDFFHFS